MVNPNKHSPADKRLNYIPDILLLLALAYGMYRMFTLSE